MAQSLEKLLNQKLAGIFAKHGLDTKFAVVKVSDRPDLSDFSATVRWRWPSHCTGTRVRLPR